MSDFLYLDCKITLTRYFPVDSKIDEQQQAYNNGSWFFLSSTKAVEVQK